MKKLLLSLLAIVFVPAIAHAYVIQHGDTLSSIARDHGTTVETLAQINGISNVDLIYAGDEIETGFAGSNLIGAATGILPEDGYDTFLTAPVSAAATEIFVNVLPSYVTSSVYTIYASDGRTVSEKVYCTGKSPSPNKLTGCIRGVNTGPDNDGVIDEDAGTGVSHSRNARIAITDNVNFTGKALSILYGNQPTGYTTLQIGDNTSTTDKFLIFQSGEPSDYEPSWKWDAGTNQLEFRRYGESTFRTVPLSLRGTYANFAALPSTDNSAGDIAITNDDNKLYTYATTTASWVLAGGSSGAGTVYRTVKLGSEADGGDNMTFSLSSGSWPESKFLQVYLNGVYMREGASYDYTITDSDTIAFNYTVANSDTIGMYVVSIDLYNAEWVNVNTDLLPDIDATHDIGSSTLQFKDLFFSGDIYQNGVAATSTPTANAIVKAGSSSTLQDGWLGGDGAGDIFFSDGTNVSSTDIGSSGQFLRVNSGATAPEWTGAPGTALDDFWYTYTVMGMTTMWTTDAGTPAFSVNKTTLNATDNESVSIRLEGPDDNGGRLWNDTQEIVVQSQIYVPETTSGVSFGFGLATNNGSVTGEDTGRQTIFQFANSGSGTKLYSRVHNGTTATESEITGYTLNSWNTFKIHWRPGTDVRFYVNGNLEGTVSSNLPSNTDVIYVRHGIDTGSSNTMIFGPTLISTSQ